MVLLRHEELIKEEKLDEKALPKEIRNKIQGLKLQIGKLNKSPENVDLQNKVKAASILIADSIQTQVVEKDLPAKGADDAASKAAAEEKVKADAEKAKADAEAAEKAKVEADEKAKADEIIAGQNKITELQNSIVEKMNASPGRYILKTDLTNILGRAPKENEKIGTLNLCEVYLSYPAHFKHYK